MPTVTLLETRLQAIADSLQQTGDGLALLGLGSAGAERERLDEFSDLDFFAVVRPGSKPHFLHNLDWLNRCAAPGFCFRNTADGYKFLYEDGVFCEFAVFEPDELAGAAFSGGRVIWSAAGFDLSLLEPHHQTGHYQRSDDHQWLLGEALTNLYVGLCRYNRGEKLSAMRFVQSFALDRLIDLIHDCQTPETGGGQADCYMPDRRLEQRFIGSEKLLKRWCQGYQRTPESALAQLNWLDLHFPVDPTIGREIRRLITLAQAQTQGKIQSQTEAQTQGSSDDEYRSVCAAS